MSKHFFMAEAAGLDPHKNIFISSHFCLRPSHKPQCGDADADGGREDRAQGREAGEKGAAGSEYVI